MDVILDIFIPILFAVISAFLAYKYKLTGLVIGAITFATGIIIRLETLMFLNPEYAPGVLGATQVITGSVFGVFWCLGFYVANYLKTKTKVKKAKK